MSAEEEPGLTKISVCWGLKFHCMLACRSALKVILMTRSFTGFIISTWSASWPATAMPPSPDAWQTKHTHTVVTPAAWRYKTPGTGSCAPHLTVEPVQRHRSVRQADHPHPGGSDVRQHSLVPGFPLLLLALGLPASALGASALSVEAQGKPASQEVLGRRVQRPCSIAPKCLDASR